MTQGCRWQEKSFNVAVKENSSREICEFCGKYMPVTRYIHNGRNLCGDCFSRQPALVKNTAFEYSFNTHKDRKYNFVTDIGGKPVEINSKKQFQNLLKKHNLADASIKEVKQEAEFRKRVNKGSDRYQRRKNAEEIFSRNRELLRFRVGR